MVLVWIQIFKTEKCEKNKFHYQSKEKVLSSNDLGRMQIWTKKDKNFIDDDLEKSSSDSEANNGYNDETESDNEYNE